MIKNFFKPSTLKEAVKLNKETKNSYYLGGGTKLNNSGETYNVEALISLEKLKLDGINKKGNTIVIGSSETIQNIIDSSSVSKFFKESCLGVTNRNIRNISTLGGVIAAGKSWSTIITGLIALDAEVETVSDGKQSVADYVKNRKKDLILNVGIPLDDKTIFHNNQRKTANSNPEVVTAISVVKIGGTISKAIVALGGIENYPVRLTGIEKKLEDGSLKDADSVQDAVMDAISGTTANKERGTYLNYISGVIVAGSVGQCMRS